MEREPNWEIGGLAKMTLGVVLLVWAILLLGSDLYLWQKTDDWHSTPISSFFVFGDLSTARWVALRHLLEGLGSLPACIALGMVGFVFFETGRTSVFGRK